MTIPEGLWNCPVFSHLNEEELRSFLHCRGGMFLEALPGTCLKLPEGGTFFGVVASGRGNVEYASGNGERNRVPVQEGDLLFPDMLRDFLIADEHLQILLLDVGKTLITCGESCPGHIQVSRNLLNLIGKHSRSGLT